MVEILPRKRGETPAHLSLKEMAVAWAREQGFGIAKKEVSLPHRKFRVDVAACAPVRKAPPRTAPSVLTEVLKAAVIFECKQARPDLRRDSLHRETLREKVRHLTERKIALETLLQLHLYKGRLKTEAVGGAVQKCDILLKRKDVYGLGVVGTSTAQGDGGGASEATGAAGRGFGVGHAQEDIGA
jgi:hypothetical protein